MANEKLLGRFSQGTDVTEFTFFKTSLVVCGQWIIGARIETRLEKRLLWQRRQEGVAALMRVAAWEMEVVGFGLQCEGCASGLADVLDVR